ncbi:polyprenyl synthetase family protein [candidate division WOR-3 bacterium]|nr:polyprenyl synthetase family protein [candidate division WOR-3 bacterium]
MSSQRPNVGLESIHRDIQKVESILHGILRRMDEPARSMLKTPLEGGKRLRPALVVLCGRLHKIPGRKMHILAAAVEVLHSATLIHDDLVDKAYLRRGRKTIQAVWPVGATVLAGDCLLAQSVCLVAQLQNPAVLSILAETLCTMSAGEIGYHYAQRDRKKRKVYFESIIAKTASLFAGAMEMIGVLAGVERIKARYLSEFGHEFGIAYQIIDDVLDFTGDERRLGKPAGSDLARGVITLPVICYLELGNDAAVIDKILSGRGAPEEIKTTIEMVRKSGAIDDALEEARMHAMKSKAALAHLHEGKARQALCRLVDHIVARGE